MASHILIVTFVFVFNYLFTKKYFKGYHYAINVLQNRIYVLLKTCPTSNKGVFLYFRLALLLVSVPIAV